MNSSPRVLLLDDDLLIAFELAQMLEQHDFEIVGPYGNVAAAMESIKLSEPDAAILDINMGDGTTSETLADDLLERDLPFVFLTGYGSAHALPKRFAKVAKMHKPARSTDVLSLLRTLTRGDA